MATVIAPWTWRNYRLYGEPVLISTNGGVTLWMGNAPGGDGPIPDRLENLNDNVRDKMIGAEAKQIIFGDPIGFILRSAIKLVRLYNNESIGVIWNADGIEREFGATAAIVLKRFTQITWAIIFSLASFGAYVCFRIKGLRRTLFSPIIGSIIFYSAVNSIILSQDRYHLAFAAQIAMLAGIALARVWSGDPQRSVPNYDLNPT
jgi:predicted membrane protein